MAWKAGVQEKCCCDLSDRGGRNAWGWWGGGEVFEVDSKVFSSGDWNNVGPAG